MKKKSHVFLTISLIVLIYTIYRDTVYNNSNDPNLLGEGIFHTYYYKYYFISIILILLSITTYFFNKKTKTKFLQISTFLIISLYSIESLLNFYQFYNLNKMVENIKNNIIKIDNFDKRSVVEFMIDKDIKKKDFLVSPILLKNENNLQILPLSSKSFTKYFRGEKEFGYYSEYITDKYGFRNLDEEWDNNAVETIIIGDSYLMAGNIDTTIPILLKKLTKGNKSVISLSNTSVGPMFHYAVAKEYAFINKVKNLILFYYEPNDLTNLEVELKIPVLKKYLEKEKFTQNLKNKQDIINNIFDDSNIIKSKQKLNVNNFSSKNYIFDRKQFNYKFNLNSFVKLGKLRNLTLEYKKKKPTEEFKIIIKKFKELSKKNNTNFYFVYVPGINRYLKGFQLSDDARYYGNVIKILEDLEINVIDLHKEFYLKASNPLEYFPLKSYGHTTLNANKLISKIIFEKIDN